MRSASWWIEWPAGLLRIGVVFLVAVGRDAVVAATRGSSRLGDDASRNSALSFADREIAGGNGLVADQAAVYARAELIPEDATYHVIVGPGYEGGSDLTRAYVDSYYRYFLLPRRPADGARRGSSATAATSRATDQPRCCGRTTRASRSCGCAVTAGSLPGIAWL